MFGHNPPVLSSTAALLGISWLLFASGGALMDPPVQGGPWRQIGAAVTSRPGKLAHFFRSARTPKALAVVAKSSSSRPIRMTWFSYCEFESDDAQTEENHATVTGVRRVTAFPHVLDGATLCNVSVTIRVVDGRATAAIFSSSL
jgi:hypothetical protein